MWEKLTRDQEILEIVTAQQYQNFAKVCSNQFTDRIIYGRKSGGRFIEQDSHNLSTATQS